MYLRTCLASSAGLAPNMESTAAMQQQAPAIGRFLRQLISEGGSRTQLVVAYVDVARQLLASLNGNFVFAAVLTLMRVTVDMCTLFYGIYCKFIIVRMTLSSLLYQESRCQTVPDFIHLTNICVCMQHVCCY